MNYGICNLSIVAVRKEPSDASEMLTQLLFGEAFEILDKQKQWRKVRLAYDDYEGWIDEKQFFILTPESYQSLISSPFVTTQDIVEVITGNDLVFPVVIGSTLPFYDDEYCHLGKIRYSYDGNIKVHTGEGEFDKSTIIENAYMFINAPYLWGGRSPFGIDCSGYTQIVYKLSGVKLKRDAYLQADQGRTINLLDEAEPGDLAFFDNEDGRIIHSGILLSDNRIIHASGRVRIDKIDYHGIYNADVQRYTHKLRLIKRIF